MKSHAKQYTRAETAWIEANKGHYPFKVLYRLFKKEFGFRSYGAFYGKVGRMTRAGELSPPVLVDAKSKTARDRARDRLVTGIQRRNQSLCWLCKRAGVSCNYENGSRPVTNWQATQTTIKESGREVDSHIVHHCPNYQGDKIQGRAHDKPTLSNR